MDRAEIEKRYLGAIVQTSYGSGPYEIVHIDGPCTCPDYLASLQASWDKPAPPSPEHLHFTCKWAGDPARHNVRETFYLNGFDLAGCNVWRDDTLQIIGYKREYQFTLL